MNLKKVILLSLLFFQIKSIAQTKKYAIACDSFRINSIASKSADPIRQIFQKIISRKEFPFTFVHKDEDKINNIFTILKNGKILKENTGKQQTDSIDFLGLDYLVTGDIKSSDNIDGKTYKIAIQFTSVSGHKVRQYLPLYFSVKKEDLEFDAIEDRLPPIFLKEITSFVNNYFEDPQKPFKLNQKSDIIDRMERSDSIINNLQKENKKINDVLDYSYIARLNSDGNPHDNIGMKIPIESDALINLMMSIIIYINPKYYGDLPPSSVPILKTDSSAEIAIDIVIKKYPKFPFGYYIKAMLLERKSDPDLLLYAKKARDIFEITTTISNHSPEHDQALANLKKILDK